MKQDSNTHHIPSNTSPSQVVWTTGIQFAVFLALLVSFGAYKLVRFPYYAATLDFKPVDSRESSHDPWSFSDTTSVLEVWGARVALALETEFTALPINHLPKIISILFYSALAALWVLSYIALGARRLLNRKQRLVAGILFVCAIMPWATFSASELQPAPSIEGFYNAEYIRLTERGASIIDALKAYHKDHSAYPNTLDELVPKYLSKVPLAGIRVCPEFTYIHPGNAEIIKQPYRRMNSPNSEVATYDLSVSLHKLRSHFASDMFYYLYYRPEEEYPSSHQRVNQWAIVSSGWVRLP